MRKRILTVVTLTAGIMAATLAPASAAPVATVAPVTSAPAAPPVSIETRHPARFGTGTWFDACDGRLYVRAPLFEYVNGLGWIPSPWGTPVQVQERVNGRWLVRATLVTNASGVASDLVRFGGGRRVVRVVKPADMWTVRVVGATRVRYVTAQQCDID